MNLKQNVEHKKAAVQRNNNNKSKDDVDDAIINTCRQKIHFNVLIYHAKKPVVYVYTVPPFSFNYSTFVIYNMYTYNIFSNRLYVQNCLPLNACTLELL